MDWIERYRNMTKYAEKMAEEERVRIIRAACESGLSRVEVARRLGTNRKAIYRLIKKYRNVELGASPFVFE